MRTPFPGMDPYLERPGLWKQVHTGLIIEIQHFLTALLRPRYRVDVEQHTYLALLPPDERLVGIPDGLILAPPSNGPTILSGSLGLSSASSMVAEQVVVMVEPIVAELPIQQEIKHRYLEIRDMEMGEVITVIEILSPANKSSRDGRKKYEKKRLKVLNSLTNLVEIDLLRAGRAMSMKVVGQAENDYRILVSRSDERPRGALYLFSVRDMIPDIPIPLRPGEEEPQLKLNHILHGLYDKSGYDMSIDYQKPATPSLSDENTAWAKTLLESGNSVTR